MVRWDLNQVCLRSKPKVLSIPLSSVSLLGSFCSSVFSVVAFPKIWPLALLCSFYPCTLGKAGIMVLFPFSCTDIFMPKWPCRYGEITSFYWITPPVLPAPVSGRLFFSIYLSFYYRSAPLSTENTFQDPQWMPKTLDSTKPYIRVYYEYICIRVYICTSDTV